MKRYRGTAAILLGAGLFAAAFAWLLKTHGPLAPVKVELAEVVRGDLERSVFGVGFVEARLAYAVGPIQPGRVLRVPVDVGDEVRAGQLVGELDPVDLDLRLDAARSAVARASHAVQAADALARETTGRARLAAKNRDRDRALFEQRVVPEAARDASGHEALAADTALSAARANSQASRQELARVEAELEALERLRDSLRLVSPADGVVVAREAEPGTTVVAGQAVVRLVDPASRWVRARVDQSRARELRVGQSATVVLRSAPDTKLVGRVSRIELESDPVTEERIVDVGFEAPPAELFLGELAEVEVALPSARDVLVVPGASLSFARGQANVWTIEDGSARFVPVTIGARGADGSAEVLSGLRTGERVVAYSSAALTEGAAVEEGKVRQ